MMVCLARSPDASPRRRASLLVVAVWLSACSQVSEVLTPIPDTTTSAGGSASTGSGGSGISGAGGSGASVGGASTSVGGSTSAGGTTDGGGSGGTAGLDVVLVDAGTEHACAVVQGSLYCWGGNQRGRLGVGDGQNRLFPTRVGTLDQWIMVTTGAEHSCALREDGSVWCFGANDAGQIGQPVVNDVLSPSAVSLAAPATLVTTESDFTCALLADGTLYCWGENTEGMLAQDDTYPGENQYLPVQVADYDDWLSVDAGQGHGCGLRSPGTLWCWGRNSQNQLGLGDSAAVQFRVPQQTGNESDWTQVQAGQNHSCGLRAGGELWCWGDNTFGNLGTGDFDPRSSPVRIDSREYSQVSLDTFHTCAIDSDAQLWCWGRNVEGQLGLGDIEDRVIPTKVPDGGWEQVAVGRFFTCAKKLDQSIWCTGENVVGQLGVGDTDRRNVFTPIELP